MSVESFANAALATLTAPAGTGDATLTVDSLASFVDPAGSPLPAPYHVLVADLSHPGQINYPEIMLVTAATGNVLTVTRAREYYNGTKQAQAHAAGHTVALVLTRESLSLLAPATQMSITSDANGIKLVNDTIASPANQVYGMNFQGTRGYWPGVFPGIANTWTVGGQVIGGTPSATVPLLTVKPTTNPAGDLFRVTTFGGNNVVRVQTSGIIAANTVLSSLTDNDVTLSLQARLTGTQTANLLELVDASSNVVTSITTSGIFFTAQPQASLTNLLPSMSGNDGKVLTAVANVATWQTAAGGGGSTILSGDAAPTVATGATGNYYEDTAAGQFYGPKGGQTEYLTFAGSPNANYLNAEYGVRVQFARAGQITGLRYTKGGGAQVTFNFTVYDGGGAVVATASQTQGATGTFDAPLSTPVSVTAGSTYTVTYSAGGSGSHINTLQPVTNAQDLTFLGYYGSGSGGGGGYGSLTLKTTESYPITPAFVPTDPWPIAVRQVPVQRSLANDPQGLMLQGD